MKPTTAKNTLAAKLSRYFAAALLCFSVLIGILFAILFTRHSIHIYKTELEQKAAAIADTAAAYIGKRSGFSGMGGYGTFLRIVDEIAGSGVWIVDSDLNLLTSGHGHGFSGRRYAYSDLPQNAERLVQEVFAGETVFSEDFSSLFSEAALTAGVPIKDAGGTVIGAVLLHAPVVGIRQAVFQGFLLLFISILSALAVSFALSVVFSRKFAAPIADKEAADALRLEKIRRDFTANISHELKTPITVLRGSLEALTEHIVTDPVTVAEYHRNMLTETRFLERLVGDLLDLSRLQNTDFIIETQPVSLDDCIRDTVRSARHLAAAKRITVLLDGSTENRIMDGDYGRLRQMFLIVLDNAVKFSPEGGTVQLLVSPRKVSVRDWGPGIESEELPHIFDRFYKTTGEQNKTGTGLGLAIAKQIAERHGIGLSAASSKETGTVFTFVFPVKDTVLTQITGMFNTERENNRRSLL